MADPLQIYHISSTNTEQVAWCLDKDSRTVCVRTPLIFSVLVEALSVDSAKGVITDKSRNVPLTEEILKKFLHERKNSFKYLTITSVEEVQLSDIYFFQGGYKKPYLRVAFSSLNGFRKFRNLFQGTADDDIEITNDDEEEAAAIRVQIPQEAEEEIKQHRNVSLITAGLFARFRILESDIAPYWHWLIHHGIRSSSTVLIPPESQEVEAGDPTRLSKADREFTDVVSLKLVDKDLSTKPKIMTWDIESLSENPTRFPSSYSIGDVAFFISAYIKRYGEPDSASRRVGIYLVDSLDTLGLTEPRLADGTELIIVQTEEELLDAFWNLIREEKPQILQGYNTMGFDSRYLHHRMSIYQKTYPNLSLMVDSECPQGTYMRQFTWSSSAYKAVECWYYDAPGLLVLDMFIELKREENLKAYTLDAVSEYFLGEHKVDLKAQEMFKIYLAYLRGERTEQTRIEMRRIAEYGMQDSVLPARLFDLRIQWVTYTQMASITGVGIMDLITRGQTLRTKANIYRACRDLGFVINVPRDKPSFVGKFKGAYVCTMTPGLHDNVIVYDFASLYPSTIAAFNLCYSTFIHRRDWAMYPPATYTAFMVSTPKGEKVEVRYVKASVFKGILPRVVEGFLAARKATRDQLKKTTDPVLKDILDKRQKAIKVTNNSVYGAVGADFATKLTAYLSDVCASSLGLKWIAMTVTEIGQTLIKGCTSFLEKKYGAVGIYGDTDSTFVQIPKEEVASLHKKAEAIAEEFNATLPPPLSIELEKIVLMIGLTAKRYLYRCYDKEGVLGPKITYKGVVATRRDTCKWQVDLFTAVSESILKDLGKEAITQIIYRKIVDLMRGRVPTKHLLIGSSVNESYKSTTCRMARLKKRMADLGKPIAGGSRIEFVVTQSIASMPGPMDSFFKSSDLPRKITYKSPYTRGPKGGINEDNVSDRVRMADEITPETKIDYTYYVDHLARKSTDQLFSAAYHGDTVIGPLIKGLQFLAEETVAEMELLISPHNIPD